MPLLVGFHSATPPVTPPTSVEQPGVYVPIWIAPDGSVWPLNPDGQPVVSLDAVSGLGVAPRSITGRPDPIGGSLTPHIQRQARRIIWPLRFHAATHMSFLNPWRAYGEAFGMTDTDGPGILRITRPDGTAREIEAYLESGFEAEPGEGWVHATAMPVLWCKDPLFRDPTPVTLERAYQATADDYLNPYPKLSSGAVLDVSTLVNPGTVEAWPVWVLTGPATAFTATNATTGESFTITYTLTLGQTITIVTRPDEITGPAGQNLVNAMTWPASKLWRLLRGANVVDLAVSGAAAGTKVTATFYARYRAA